jgi:hypothetical protein
VDGTPTSPSTARRRDWGDGDLTLVPPRSHRDRGAVGLVCSRCLMSVTLPSGKGSAVVTAGPPVLWPPSRSGESGTQTPAFAQLLFGFFWAVVGFELRAFRSPGRRSTPPSTLLWWLWGWGHLKDLPGLALNPDPPDLGLSVAGVTGMGHGLCPSGTPESICPGYRWTGSRVQPRLAPASPSSRLGLPAAGITGVRGSPGSRPFCDHRDSRPTRVLPARAPRWSLGAPVLSPDSRTQSGRRDVQMGVPVSRL